MEQTSKEKSELNEKLQKIDQKWLSSFNEQKENMQRENEYLKADLKEAQNRIAELSFLTDRLASDAKNSEHLVADIL